MGWGSVREACGPLVMDGVPLLQFAAPTTLDAIFRGHLGLITLGVNNGMRYHR